MLAHRPVLPVAAILLILAGSALPTGAWQEGAVIASDYVSAASVGRILGQEPWTVTPDLVAIHPDAVGVWHDGLVWIVNRGGADNIQVLDPTDDFATMRQFSVGLGRNPQDIAFVGDRAYVSCYDAAELLEIDPQSGAIVDIHSTAAFADADGLPETQWLEPVGDRLLVTCERLDRNNWYTPVGDSYLLVFDTAAGAWIDVDPETAGLQGLRLQHTNPYAAPVRAGDHLLVACLGFYGVTDGGVERIDAVALASVGVEITESELAGDIVDLDLGPDDHRHAIVSDALFVTSVVQYDADGAVSVLDPGVAFDHADVRYDGDFQLFVADRRAGAAGVRVFDAVSGTELTSFPLPTGLPPSSFVFPPLNPATPVAITPRAALALAAPWPNPANPATTVAFTAPASAVVELRVVDLRGRLVLRDRVTTGTDGRGVWRFSGRDSSRRPVASGVYRIVAQGGGGFAARSLTIVR